MTKKTHVERTSAKPLYRFAALEAVLLAVCLVFMMPVSAWTVNSNWGSNYDSITEFDIADAGDLAQFSKMVNEGNTFQGKTVKLTADIDLENQEWTPIGDDGYNNLFSGTFDGNGKTISGLQITSANDGFVGLFGFIKTLFLFHMCSKENPIHPNQNLNLKKPQAHPDGQYLMHTLHTQASLHRDTRHRREQPKKRRKMCF